MEFKDWLLTAAGVFITFFLQKLHKKVEDSVSRRELEELSKRVDEAVMKIDFETTIRDLKIEYEADRRELRDNQVKLFDKLDMQQQLLTQVATQVAMLLEAQRNRRSNDV